MRERGEGKVVRGGREGAKNYDMFCNELVYRIVYVPCKLTIDYS